MKKNIYTLFIAAGIFASNQALAQCTSATTLLVDLKMENTSTDSSLYHQSVLEYETVAYTTDRNGNANGALNTSAGTIFLTNDQNGNFKCQFPFTFSAWVKSNALGARNPIFMNEDHGSAYSGAWINILQSGAVIASVGNGGPAGPTSRLSATTVSQPIVAGNWYHIAVVFNSISDIDIYVNGVQESVNYTGSAASLYYYMISGTAGKIGSGVNGSGTNAYFNGAIDDLRFWNVALDATRLQALYNSHLDFINVGSISICNDNEFTDVTAPNEQCDYNWSNGDNDAVNSIYGNVLGEGVHIIYARVYDSRNILYTDSVIVTVSTCTGLNDSPTAEISGAYPNPVKDILTIDAATPGYFTLFNVLGDALVSTRVQKRESLDVGQYAPGIYLLTELNTGKTTKVIKE